MDEKLQKFVNASHKLVKKKVDKIRIHNLQTKEDILQKVDVCWEKMSDFIVWVTKYAFLDDRIVHKLETEFEYIKNIANKQYKEIAAKKILKKYPLVKALLMYLLLISGTVINGTTVFKNRKDKKENKTEVVSNKTDKDNTVDTISSDIDVYFPSVFVGLSELETYRDTPRLHQGENRYTYYLGLTWVYERGANGKLIQHACVGKWKDKSVQFTNKECQEQVKMHLEYETFKKVHAVYKNTDVAENYNVIVGLLLAGYQRSGDIKGIAQLLSVAKNSQDIADAFTYYKGNKKWKNGTLKRRWICAAYAVGVIDDNDLLNMRMDAFANLKIDTYCSRDKNGKLHFNLDHNTVSKVLGIKSKNRFVRDFVGLDIINSMLRGPKTIDFMFIKDMENNDNEEKLKIFSFNKGIKKLQEGKAAKYNSCVDFVQSLNKDV